MKEREFDKHFSFLSIKNPDQRIRDFWNTINSEKVNVNILHDSDVGTCNVQGNNVIWINVPPADYRSKPVYNNYDIQPEQEHITDIVSYESEFRNDTDRLIYEYILTNGFITVSQVVALTKITTTQGANTALSRLMKADLIRKVRQGRHFIYQLK